MTAELRLPKITGRTDHEMLMEIKSYLTQFVPQLQYALEQMGASGTGTTVVKTVGQLKGAPKSEEGFDATVAFEALKPLIIKSADIIKVYSDAINRRLNGEYVAKSDFGEFKEATENDIMVNSTGITQNYRDIQSIQLGQEDFDSAIYSLNYTLTEVYSHIRTGLLYYDKGLPVYGLEVGQRTIVEGQEDFKKFARFIADRLSFYDQNDQEVAYISDYRLYIRSVEILVSFRLGGILSTVLPGGDVVERWAGGDS